MPTPHQFPSRSFRPLLTLVLALVLAACTPEKKDTAVARAGNDSLPASAAPPDNTAAAARADSSTPDGTRGPAVGNPGDKAAPAATPAAGQAGTKPKTPAAAPAAKPKEKYLASTDNSPDPDPNEAVLLEYEPALQDAAALQARLAAAQRPAGASGTVYLKVLVDREGRFRDHRLRQSPDARLTEIVVGALRQARWSPARLNGIPVKAWVGFEYSFQ